MPTEAPSGGESRKYVPDLEARKKNFDEFRELSVKSREWAMQARDYYDGNQLSPERIAALRARKQPDIVWNSVRHAINGTLGVVEQGKTDPRAYMRNPPQNMQQQGGQQPPPGAQPPPMMGHNGGPPMPAEPPLDAGDVASMTLRFIADTNKFSTLKMDVLENMMIEGCGAAVFEWDGAEVAVTQIRWEEFFYDPRSRKHDFGDARYLGIAKWMYADDILTLPGLTEDQRASVRDFAANGAGGWGGYDQSWEDRPQDARHPWVDGKNRRLMVVEMYHREAGEWHHCIFHVGGMLVGEPSPYKDDKGQSTCPIEGQSCYVDKENNRYGLIRDMIGPQDEINNRHSKAMHEMNTRQLQPIDADTPPVDVDIARQEASRPDGVIPAGWQIVPRQDVIANNVDMLQFAKSEIERMGPNPAILGRQGSDESGRAQQIRQQAGLIELARPLGRFRAWEDRSYGRQMWGRARQFYTAPKWIRVTGDDGAPRYVMINDPLGEHHIARMDVDIVLDAVPNTATLEQEIFEGLLSLAQAYAGTNEQVPFKTMLRLSPLPKRRQIEQDMDSARAQAAQANAQAVQLEVAEKTSGIEKTQAETNLTEVKTVTEAMRGSMEASAAHAMPPGTAEIANLPQNKPQPNGAGG